LPARATSARYSKYHSYLRGRLPLLPRSYKSLARGTRRLNRPAERSSAPNNPLIRIEKGSTGERLRLPPPAPPPLPRPPPPPQPLSGTPAVIQVAESTSPTVAKVRNANWVLGPERNYSQVLLKWWPWRRRDSFRCYLTSLSKVSPLAFDWRCLFARLLLAQPGPLNISGAINRASAHHFIPFPSCCHLRLPALRLRRPKPGKDAAACTENEKQKKEKKKEKGTSASSFRPVILHSLSTVSI
jgi:hypothetical protein